MKILVIGSGGREHALCWKLAQSPIATEVLCAPGNAGTAKVARNVAISASDITALADFAESEKAGLTVVGPDDTLAAGVVDEFKKRGLRIFGPDQAAAKLESSKIFAKEFMRRHNIPTAASGEFSDIAEALRFLASAHFPVVVKADGLALGKGVIIAQDHGEAETAIRSMLEDGRFGDAGKHVLIEEFLVGTECSIHAIFDASTYLAFPAARDHKRAHDGDEGPNTGGMGTLSPPPDMDAATMELIHQTVLRPFLRGVKEDGIDFRGMLFPGLMLTGDGPKVLEFNCRFGDPETQVLLPRLKSDLVEMLLAATDNRLAEHTPEWSSRAAVCIVVASGGYPGDYAKGLPISGLDDAQLVFHAGTRDDGEQVVTSGGRVLGVVGMGDDLATARAEAYEEVEHIEFKGAFFRKDIGILR